MIGLIFHGPEMIDSGEASEALEMLASITPNFKAFLGGISGKTAVIDAGLTDVIDITQQKLPSELITDLIREGYKFILLLNHAKSKTSGLALGEGIFRRVVSQARGGFSFVQIDYNGFAVPWRIEGRETERYGQLLNLFALREIKPPDREERIKKAGKKTYRNVEGVKAGEKILVDGIVIGVARCEDVVIIEENGKIVGLEGGNIIEENLLKLDYVTLESAMVKSVGYFREHAPEVKGSFKRDVCEDKVALLFTADRVFEVLERVSGVVTIGDDTTAIVADIANRFDVPVLGITDGDLDGLIPEIGSGEKFEFERIAPKGSLIFRVRPEFDDEIGYRIKDEIFGGRDEIEIDFKVLCERVLEILGEDDVLWVTSLSV
ncbi:MAG: DUF2117 domain-containing protein [Candidatus Syntropharchaeales archaeon]